jgi:N-terminal domain of anti-restriction factor ArdC
MGSVLKLGSGGDASKRRASRARAVARDAGQPPRGSLYDEVTAKIIAQLEAGVFPWAQPWSAAACPSNIALMHRLCPSVNLCRCYRVNLSPSSG